MQTGYRPAVGRTSRGKSGRSEPYFSSPPEKPTGIYVPPPAHFRSQAEQDDLQLAVDELLRAVARKASTMTLADIVALTAAFSEPEAQDVSDGYGIASETPLPPAPPPPAAVAPRAFGAAIGAPIAVSHAIAAAMDQRGGFDQLVEEGVPLPMMQEICGQLQTVKVSVKANVKSIAGAVSKALRSTEALVASAVGAEGVNHAVKALAIARCYLAAEGLDLTATVCEVRREDGIARDRYSAEGRVFALTVWRKFVPAKIDAMATAGVGRTEPHERYVRPLGCQTELKVSGQGLATTLAGAVAKALREDKEVLVTAVGPQAVAKALEAIALARMYVQQDGVALAFYPEFHQVTMQGQISGNDELRSGVRFHAWPDNGLV